MKKISTKSLFEKNINEIWDNPKFNEIELKERGYALQDEIILEALLFVGLNPSYSNKNDVGRFFYKNEQEGDVHKYFKKFQEISISSNIKWAHTDLLFLRETKQDKIETIYSLKNGTEFIYEQLLISKKIIELSKPKIIIVNNSLSRKYLGFEKINNVNIWIGLDFKFDEKIGTHRIVNNEKLENTPIFFTSMLTGQRALDKGSFERLKWHINFVLKTLN